MNVNVNDYDLIVRTDKNIGYGFVYQLGRLSLYALISIQDSDEQMPTKLLSDIIMPLDFISTVQCYYKNIYIILRSYRLELEKNCN